MVGKNNQQNQFKQRSEHMERYGIRKLKVGVASVAIASCFLLPSAMSVSAAETKPVSTDQVRKMNQGAKENKKIKSKIQAYSSGQAAANLKQSALADNLQTKGNSVGVTDHQDPVKKDQTSKEKDHQAVTSEIKDKKTEQKTKQDTPVDETSSNKVPVNQNHPEAQDQPTANDQVTNEKSGKVYNLRFVYTLADNTLSQLYQPYEMTVTEREINKQKFVKYLEVPHLVGYRTDSGTYVKKDNQYVLAGDLDEKETHYIKIDADYIKMHAQIDANDKSGLCYSGIVNVPYTPEQRVYYVRHLVQKFDKPNEFEDVKLPDSVYKVTKTITENGKQK